MAASPPNNLRSDVSKVAATAFGADPGVWSPLFQYESESFLSFLLSFKIQVKGQTYKTKERMSLSDESEPIEVEREESRETFYLKNFLGFFAFL